MKNDRFRRIFVEVKNGKTVPKDNFQRRGGREIQKEFSTIVNPEDNEQSFRIQSSQYCVAASVIFLKEQLLEK